MTLPPLPRPVRALARAAPRGARLVFDGRIAGQGTGSGTRLVPGHWPRSPFGPVSDLTVSSAFGSVPARPALVRVTTTVELPAAGS